MRTAAAVSLIVGSLVANTACDSPGPTLRSPTTPSPPAAPSPPAPPPAAAAPPGFASIRAAVALTAIIPVSGTTVPVRDCPPGPFGTLSLLCTDQLRATFSVVNDGPPRAGRLRVVFSDGARPCGSTWLPQTSLTPGTALTLSTSTVFLSWETSEGLGPPVTLIQPCELPVTTTRITIELWEQGNARTPIAAQEFDGSYTFAR